MSKNASSHDFSPRMGMSCSGAEFPAHDTHSGCGHGNRRGGGRRRGSIVRCLLGKRPNVGCAGTLVGPVPAVPTAINMPQSSPEKASYAESKEGRLSENRLNDPPTNELNANPPAHPAAVTASAKVRVASGGGSAKAAVVPAPAVPIRPKHLAQRPRREDLVSSLPQQHSLASRTDPNLLQRFFAGLTAAIEHVWSPSISPGSRTSRARGDASATAT